MMVIAFNFKPSEMIFPESGHKGLVAFVCNDFLNGVFIVGGCMLGYGRVMGEGFGPPDGFGFIYLKINSNIKIT